MNGAHDMGGMMGFGPVLPEPDEPVFHAPWEARVFALVTAAGEHGRWTPDEDRATCENRPPAEHLRLSYYEIWLAALSKLLTEKAVTGTPPSPRQVLRPENVAAAMLARNEYARPAPAPPKFQIGAKVLARNLNPTGHTRLPRYLRGHAGEIGAVHGAHVYPDSNAHGLGEDPRWLYTVRFAAGEVWGNSSRDKIYADLWEPYLAAL